MARKPHPTKCALPAFRAVKPREYGTTKAVVAEAFKQAGGAKRVGVFFDLGLSIVYGFTDPDAKGCDLSLDRARRLTYTEGVEAFAADFCALAGGVFLAPHIVRQGEGLAQVGSDISHSVADVVGELLKAVADGKLSGPERADLLSRCDTAIAAQVALRARLMEGDAP